MSGLLEKLRAATGGDPPTTPPTAPQQKGPNQTAVEAELSAFKTEEEWGFVKTLFDEIKSLGGGKGGT